MASESSNRKFSEPGHSLSSDKAKSPYYHADISSRLVPETQELLEKYSGIPRDQQSKHIHEIVSHRRSRSTSNESTRLTRVQRDKAWDIRAWPCVGLGAWLTPQLSHMPVYAEVLRRVGEGALLVDVGTFFGHDLRRLAYDGAPSDKLYGVDIINHYDVGYEFFRDRGRFGGHFIQADILSDDSAELAALKGRVDVVVVSQVLHQWDWDGQLKAARALERYTRPGSIVVGNQVGNLEGKEVWLDAIRKPAYKHNPDSFTRMWDEVGTATGSKWETEAVLRSFETLGWDKDDTAWLESDARLIEFVARRVS